MKAVLGVAHRDLTAAWVYLEAAKDGISIASARSFECESVMSAMSDGIRETGCRNVATVLAGDDVYVGSFDPKLTRRRSRRQILQMCLSIAAQLRFDRKRDDIRFVRADASVAFGAARSSAIAAMKSAAKQNGARLVGLHAESHALASVLPPDYEVAAYRADGIYYVAFIASDATKVQVCENVDELAAAIVEASASGYIGGHLTPIAALDDAVFSLRDYRGLFHGRAIERFEVPYNLEGLGIVALGAGYAMFEEPHARG